MGQEEGEEVEGARRRTWAPAVASRTVLQPSRCAASGATASARATRGGREAVPEMKVQVLGGEEVEEVEEVKVLGLEHPNAQF